MSAALSVNGHVYRITVDTTTEQAAIAWLRVVDEDGVTPVSIPSPPAVSDPRLVARVKDGGLLVIVGDPAVALPDPSLPPPFTIAVTVPGFRDATQTIALPPHPVLPVALPVLTLRRSPVSLGGRAVLVATGAPIAGATLSYMPVPAIPGQMILPLGQTLPEDVAPLTPLHGVVLTPVGGPVPIKRVVQTLPAGSTWLTLDDRQALATGQILRIGPDERVSLARIAVVSAEPADMTKPGIVLLSTPLTATARQGDACRAFSTGATVSRTTAGQAFAGEALLLVDAVPAGDALIVGAAATGIPFTRAPATDADGYYRQTGIARFPALAVSVAAAGLQPQTTDWFPAAGTSRIDWRMRP